MVIGLTGGIGSGKSTVAKVFEAMGCLVYYSDERARALYFEPAVRARVIELLGEAAYHDQSTLNREFIASRVFDDASLLGQLNAIIHPAVKEDLARFREAQRKDAVIVKETALLFEAGIDKEVDLAVLVLAPEAIKVERVMKRSSLGREEVLKRMGSQWSDERKMQLAGRIINNDGMSAVIPQVAAILASL